MAADALSTELIHQILHHLGISLHTEEKTALLQCSLVSHLFLALSREVLLSNLTINLNCDSPNSATRIPAFFDLLLHPDCSFTRPLSLNIICPPVLEHDPAPHWEQALLSLMEGFERYKSLVTVDSMKVEIPPQSWHDRHRIIQALGAMAQPCIRKLDVDDIFDDEELRAWMDVVSHGRCPNLQDLQLRSFVPISDLGVPGASPSSLTVLSLQGRMRPLWISFLNWVERGGAVLKSLSLCWEVDDKYDGALPSLLRNVFSHRATSQLRKISFDGPSIAVNLAHIPSLRFVSIFVDQYLDPQPLGLTPETLHMLSSLKQYRTPLTIIIKIILTFTAVRADAVSLDDSLVEFLQERRTITAHPLTIEFWDMSPHKLTDAEELANLYVPKLRCLTELTKGELRQWSMQSVPF